MSSNEHKNFTDDELMNFVILLDIQVLNPEALTRAYKAKIRNHHVDKGGELEIAQAITQAYRILKLCLENNRYVPTPITRAEPSASSSRRTGNYEQYYQYAEEEKEEEFQAFKKPFYPRNKKHPNFFKPSKFDRAFAPGASRPRPEDAEDPFETPIGKARSKPKRYNNDYTYDDDDEFIPNDKQNYCTKDEGEPRVVRGGLELRKPLSGIELPDNYDQLSHSEIKLDELTKEELESNHYLKELNKLLAEYEEKPSYETLLQRTKAFVHLDWAQSQQEDSTPYQNIAIDRSRNGIVTIILPEWEEDEIVDDRLKEGAMIQIFSVEDPSIIAKATVETVDLELHKITVSFSNATAGERLVDSGHRCNISMAPSRFIYRAFIRGIDEIVKHDMKDFVYPQPEFETTYEDEELLIKQRIADAINHEQATGDVKFNEEQEFAIDAVVNNSSQKYPFLLFGPPGTGKTATLVECIHRITKAGKENRILVCTPSNMAADVIALALLKRDILDPKYIFRMNSLSFDYKKSNPELHKVSCILKEGSQHCFGIPCIRNLQVFRVIITTLTSSTYLNMAGGMRGYFSHILIDESAQATEQETMIPIGGLAVPGKTAIALFGDPKQLGAVDRIPILRDFGYSQSMMERLMNSPEYQSGDRRLLVQLNQNYRTHGLILRPASRLFYRTKLISMKDDKRLYGLCGWDQLPNPNFPIIFHSCRGSLEIKSATHSYKNNHEIKYCIEYVKKLRDDSIALTDIGIISPYKFQCFSVKEELERERLYGVTVNSVEGFQGSERKVIIFLTTRTNAMGFLSCDKRLNTSITRAQQLLIIIGDENLLSEHPSWKQTIFYIKFHGGFKNSRLLASEEAPVVPPGFVFSRQICNEPYQPIYDGIPINEKFINPAYHNTTERMKEEYDVDDDHDFDFNGPDLTSAHNVEADELIETMENIQIYDRYYNEFENTDRDFPLEEAQERSRNNYNNRQQTRRQYDYDLDDNDYYDHYDYPPGYHPDERQDYHPQNHSDNYYDDYDQPYQENHRDYGNHSSNDQYGRSDDYKNDRNNRDHYQNYDYDRSRQSQSQYNGNYRQDNRNQRNDDRYYDDYDNNHHYKKYDNQNGSRHQNDHYENAYHDDRQNRPRNNEDYPPQHHNHPNNGYNNYYYDDHQQQPYQERPQYYEDYRRERQSNYDRRNNDYPRYQKNYDNYHNEPQNGYDYNSHNDRNERYSPRYNDQHHDYSGNVQNDDSEIFYDAQDGYDSNQYNDEYQDFQANRDNGYQRPRDATYRRSNEENFENDRFRNDQPRGKNEDIATSNRTYDPDRLRNQGQNNRRSGDNFQNLADDILRRLEE